MRIMSALFLCLLAAPVNAEKGAGCVAYGNEAETYTWKLCPNGVALERTYLYFGYWSAYEPNKYHTSKCEWRSSEWICPGKQFVCSAIQCRQK